MVKPLTVESTSAKENVMKGRVLHALGILIDLYIVLVAVIKLKLSLGENGKHALIQFRIANLHVTDIYHVVSISAKKPVTQVLAKLAMKWQSNHVDVAKTLEI